MRARSGFTLVEVLVALMLTGIVAVGVRQVYAALGNSGARASAAGHALDREANADRLIRAVVAAAEVSEDRRLVGDRDSVAFSAWCMTPRGWLERRDVRIRLIEHSGSRELSLAISGLDSLTIRTTDADAELVYLNELDAGGLWASHWTSRLSLPRAIGVVSARDTIILRIGDRG